MQAVTPESRGALARATQFVTMAKRCHGDERVDFEAFIEAAIVFARSALHRTKAKFEKHPNWQAWWDALGENQSVLFFRVHRDLVLKEGPVQIGQIVSVSRIGGGGAAEAPTLNRAEDAYYFDLNERPTLTIERHVRAMEQLLTQAATLFADIETFKTNPQPQVQKESASPGHSEPEAGPLGHIHLRLPMIKKTAYVRAAKPGKLAPWVLRQLDDAARAAGQNPGPAFADEQ